MNTFAFIYLGAMCVAAILTPLVARAALAWGLVDLPTVRKVHRVPTPRIGGIAIFLATALVLVPVLLLRNAQGQALRAFHSEAVVMMAAAAFIFLVGLLDDLKDLPSRLKLIALLGCSIAVCAAGVRINALGVGGWSFQLGWLSWPITVGWIVVVTVGVNFTDGLDGLAAGISAIASAAIAIVALHTGHMVMATAAFALLGSLTGFLFFNFNPAKIFMGDCGSLFLGFALATGAVACPTYGRYGSVANLALPAAALAVPLVDTALTMIRRGVLQRRSLFSAERGHVHHKLIDMGLHQRQAVIALYAVTLLSSGIGVFMLYASRLTTLVVLACVLVLLMVALFRYAGSMKIGETIAAFRRNQKLGRDAKGERKTFEDMQLRLAHAQTFDSWWTEMCAAGEMLDFVRITLPLVKRDGTERELVWISTHPPEKAADPRSPLVESSDGMTLTDAAPSPEDSGLSATSGAPEHEAESLSAEVPICHRRVGSPMRAVVRVACNGSLESAGRRLALFARLMEEYSIADLPDLPVLRPSVGLDAGAASGDVAAHQTVMPALPARDDADGDPERLLPTNLRVAVVHDFLYCYAGAERVLEQILRVVPGADVFSLFDFLPEHLRGFLGGRPVTTSFIQNLPWAQRKHRSYLPLMPLAIEQLDVSNYDLVISSSYVAAKGVITRPDQLHVCYCHTPVRFAWDLQHQYLTESKLDRGVKSMLARAVLHYIRNWDARSSNGVDAFVTNSNFVARRIQKFYRRRSTTIYPPVDIERFSLQTQKEDFYLTVSRMVPYKRIDLIVEAFSRTPHRRLIVVGEGPEMEKIKAKAGPNIKLAGHQPFERLRYYMQLARAFVFAAEEDFGIVPVEAQACGTPVIAYGRGGVTESVIPRQTGVFFAEQTVDSLLAAVDEFETLQWDPVRIRRNAERFSSLKFRERLLMLLGKEWASYRTVRLREAADLVMQPDSAQLARQLKRRLRRRESDTVNGGGESAAPAVRAAVEPGDTE